MSPIPSPSARRIPWLELVLLFVGSRALIAILGWATPLVFRPGEWFGTPGRFPGVFMRWDTGWYLDIARFGYFVRTDGSSTAAFFPLYPLLVRAFGWLLGNLEMAGLLISNLMLFGATVLLWQIAEDPADDPAAALRGGDGRRAVRLLLFGPVSLFFSLVYTEATFLFLLLSSLRAARQRIWWLAGLLAGFAALTRNSGVLLTVPLLLELFTVQPQRPFLRLDIRWHQVAWCLLPAAVFAAWAFGIGRYLNDPLILWTTQKAWNRQLDWPWRSFQAIRLVAFPLFYRVWFVGHAGVALLLLGAAAWMRIRLSFVVLALLMLTLNLSATHLESIPRWTSVIFPLYLSGAALIRRWPALEIPVLGCSAGMLALSTILFVNGYWFT
jgi:hypothetical protein